MLCGLLYMSSGTGLTIFLVLNHWIGRNKNAAKKTVSAFSFGEHTGSDIRWLIAAIVVGGIFAPLLLLAAMKTATASSVSLLLNFEIVITALVARFVFHESLSRRVVIGLVTIFLGGLCLSFSKDIEGSWSMLLALGACVCWAADSNLTGQVKHIDAMKISQCKGLLSGTVNISVALMLGGHLPGIATIGGAAITGILSHGISLTCFVIAIREIGAARAVAYVATEPFIAALLSVIFLHEKVNLQMVAAGVLMGVGVWLHLTEKHPAKHVDGTIIASGLAE